MAISSAQGPLTRALIESAVLGSKQDHLDLWDEANLTLQNLQSQVAALQKTAGSSSSSSTTSTTSTSGGGGSSGGGSGGGSGSGVTFAGDLKGNDSSQTVVGWDGIPLDQSMVQPADQSVPVYDNDQNCWVAGSLAQQLDYKASCRLASNGALPAYTYAGGVITGNSDGALTVDGVTPNVGDRILLKDGAAGSDNGIYVVTQVGDSGDPYILTRSSDCNTSDNYVTGSVTFIEQGTANAGSGWIVQTQGTITVGTTDVTWEQIGSEPGIVIGFIINNGTAGTDVGPILIAPRAGSITKCKVVTKQSDASTALTFRIKQNGADVFSADPTVAAGTAGGTLNTFTSLTSSPLPIAADDQFTIDITSGASDWQFTAQLE